MEERRAYSEWETRQIPFMDGRPDRDRTIDSRDIAVLKQSLDQWADVRDFIERA